MVITINKRTIVPTLIIALAFSRTIKSMTTWVYPFLMMFVFLIHNDILKDYIELGFIGFFLIYYYLFVHMPMKIFGTIKSKNVKILIALMIYLLVTLFTDNVFEYIAFMGAFMVILASLKIEDEEFPV